MNRTLIAFLFFVLMHTFSAAQNPFIRQFTTNDGLPTNTIYQIIQDHQGFIWMGSDAGLIKFDGSVFTNYRKSDGLSSNDIVRLKEDNQGRIWISSYNGALDYIKDGKIHNSINTPFLKQISGRGFIIDFFYDKDSSICFYNYQGDIFQLNKSNKVVKFSLKPPLRDTPNKHYPFYRINKILRFNSEYIILSSQGLFLYKDPLIDSPDIISDLDSQQSIMISNREILILSINGLYILELSYRRITRLSDNYTFNTVKAINYDSNKNIWIASLGEGVISIRDKKILSIIDIEDAHGIMVDKNGNIWISTQQNGAYIIQNNFLYQLHYDTKLFGNSKPVSLKTDPITGLWITTLSSVYLMKNGQFFKLILHDKNAAIRNFIPYRNLLYLDAYARFAKILFGLKIDDIKKEIHYSLKKPVYIFAKYTVLDTTKNEEKFFSQNTVYTISTNTPFKEISSNYLSERIYSAFLFSNRKVITCGTKIFELQGSELIPYLPLSKFNGSKITDHLILDNDCDLLLIEDERLFITKNNMIFDLSSSLSEPITKPIKKILKYKDDIILITSSNVIICREPLGSIYSPFQLIKVDVIPVNFNNINDVAIYKDSIYVASNDGLTSLALRNISGINTNPPKPYLFSVSIDDRMINILDNSITIKSNYKLFLTFGSIDFNSGNLFYSYSLEGSDTKWITYSGNQLNLIYQNLPPGKYKFKVKARKTNSDWSQPLEIAIKVKPTLLQNPFFRIFLLLLFGGAIALFFNFRRIRKMKKIQDELQLVMMEQKALQAMMNPHFIFNSLGSVQNYLLKNNNKDAVIYLSDLAKHIRQNLDALKTSFVLLDEEQNRLVNYLDLERKRLEGIFGYNIFIDDEFFDETIYIPGMMVQPFVENSIWHGIALVESGAQIDISFKKNGDNTLLVEIIDNGIGVEQGIVNSVKNARKSGLGISVTQKRLQLLGKKYKIETSLIISDAATGNINPGTRVQMVLPFFYSKKKIDE